MYLKQICNSRTTLYTIMGCFFIFCLIFLNPGINDYADAKECGLDLNCGFGKLQWEDSPKDLEPDKTGWVKLGDGRYVLKNTAIEGIKFKMVVLGFIDEEFVDVNAIVEESDVEKLKDLISSRIGKPIKKNNNYIWRVTKSKKDCSLIFNSSNEVIFAVYKSQ